MPLVHAASPAFSNQNLISTPLSQLSKRKGVTTEDLDKIAWMRGRMPAMSVETAGRFTWRKFGHYWGCQIECPTCHVKPPTELKGSAARWKWVFMHSEEEHEKRRR